MNDTRMRLKEDTIAAFGQDSCDLDAVKQNILWYAAINLPHGALRPETPPSLPPGLQGQVDPALAEIEDRERQQAARKTEKALADPALVAQLAELAAQGRYDPFNWQANLANQVTAIAAITGCVPETGLLKETYISALNAVQNTSLVCQAQLAVSFDNPQLLDELCREGLIAFSPQHLFAPSEQPYIASRIGDALSLIKAVDEDLHDAIHDMISTIACVRREGSSGTVSSMIGLIWLNPDASWTVLDFAENIVHEFIHNTIFLADLVQKIFVTPHWYAPQEALVVSAIKQYPRGVNIAFHSLFVAIGLAIFMNKARQSARALELTSGLVETSGGLKEKAAVYLSAFGSRMLDQIGLNEHVAAA